MKVKIFSSFGKSQTAFTQNEGDEWTRRKRRRKRRSADDDHDEWWWWWLRWWFRWTRQILGPR
jgi:hypothetical protein